MARLPLDASQSLNVSELQLSMSDEEFATTIEEVVTNEICRGEGANFIISREGRLRISGMTDAVVMDLFARLIEAEPYAYMVFCFFDGNRYFVGASPERHLTVQDGKVTMSPICGTLPKSALNRRAEASDRQFQVPSQRCRRQCRVGRGLVGEYRHPAMCERWRCL